MSVDKHLIDCVALNRWGVSTGGKQGAVNPLSSNRC